MSPETLPSFHDPVDPPPSGQPWTVLRLLRWSTQYLEGKGVPESRVDVEHLLAHVLGLNRLELYLNFERPLTSRELESFKPLLLARAERRPVQYILGRAAFRELELEVDPRVLIPRQETEELVEAVLNRVREWGREGLVALDVGTGSGAIALSLASEGPFRRIVATDSSPAALEVARTNARTAGVAAERVEFRVGDLFDPVEAGETFDVVVANPPYVSREDHRKLEPEVREWEPDGALVADQKGLEVLLRLVQGAPGVLAVGGLLALETGAEQAGVVAAEIDSTGSFEPAVVLRDMSRRDRMVLAVRRSTAGEA